MTFLVGIANFFGISVFRLVAYAVIVVAATVALATVRQHYINVGWAAHKAAVEKQDARSVATSNKVEEKTNVCSEANGFWDVITQGCKLEEGVQ